MQAQSQETQQSRGTRAQMELNPQSPSPSLPLDVLSSSVNVVSTWSGWSGDEGRFTKTSSIFEFLWQLRAVTSTRLPSPQARSSSSPHVGATVKDRVQLVSIVIPVAMSKRHFRHGISTVTSCYHVEEVSYFFKLFKSQFWLNRTS